MDKERCNLFTHYERFTSKMFMGMNELLISKKDSALPSISLYRDITIMEKSREAIFAPRGIVS